MTQSKTIFLEQKSPKKSKWPHDSHIVIKRTWGEYARVYKTPMIRLRPNIRKSSGFLQHLPEQEVKFFLNIKYRKRMWPYLYNGTQLFWRVSGLKHRYGNQCNVRRR